MKFLADKQVIKLLDHQETENAILSGGSEVYFGWSSLLEYLNLGSLFKNLPVFNSEEPLYKAFLAALLVNQEQEALFYLYDSLFAECLTQIKALPQINPSFLLHAIKHKEHPIKELSSTLVAYETALIENPADTMHDLVLYLAWDRMCVYMGRLFDYQSSDPAFIRSLEVLKGCLIESFLHITQQGRTSPSFYRLIEALFFFEMREENLQKHSGEVWEILSQNFKILRPQEEMVDFYYIDDAVIPLQQSETAVRSSTSYLSMDSPDKVDLRLSLARYFMNKLKAEVPEWSYKIQIKQVSYLT
ncbi:MAG: hypothetical protein H0V82_09655 [Candidatus Protochlamydia sp.]|nr:hypothetical protein [Candidatus Protochlamydia sp.]